MDEFGGKYTKTDARRNRKLQQKNISDFTSFHFRNAKLVKVIVLLMVTYGEGRTIP